MVNLYSQQDTGANLDFVQNTSATSHFTPRWKLGVMAQGAMLKGMANSKLRRILDRDQSFECTGIRVGDSAIFYEQISRKSTPEWRGPAIVSDIDENSVTAKFQSRTVENSRYSVRGRMATWPDSPVGTRDTGELLRDGKCADRPMDVEVPP